MADDVRPSDAMPDQDGTVVQRVLAGDREAFRELVVRYQNPVFRLARNLLRSAGRAEELTQEVFLAAYGALPDFDPGRGRFSSWLLAIARNKCINDNKKKRAILLDELPGPIDPRTPCDALAQREQFERFDQALDALPDEQRSAFVLRELVGLSTAELAQIEGVDKATIRSRVSRAKAQLRAALDPARGDET